LQEETYKAIEHIANQLKNIEGVIGIVLFGSYSRGDYEEGSDIDLVVVFEDREALSTGRDQLYKTTAETDLFLQAIALTLDELKSSTLLESLLRDGRICYATEEVKKLLTPLHRPYALLTYSTSNLDAKQRVVFTQQLEGRRGGKYRYEGLLQKIGGYKVGRGVIMVPLENLRKATQHLEERRVEYTIRYVWM